MKQLLYTIALSLVALCPQAYAAQAELKNPMDVLRARDNNRIKRVMQSRCEELKHEDDRQLCHRKKSFLREMQREDIRDGLTPAIKRGAWRSALITWGLMPPMMFWAKLPFAVPATLGILGGMGYAFHNGNKNIADIIVDYSKRTQQMHYHQKRWHDALVSTVPRQASEFDEPVTEAEIEAYFHRLEIKR